MTTAARNAAIMVLAACAAWGGQTGAMQRPPAGCRAAAFSQLDFWTGHWEVRWRASDGQAGIGHNRVGRDFAGCVVVERFQDRTTDFAGTSIATLAGPAGWSLVWMDNRGMSFQGADRPARAGR